MKIKAFIATYVSFLLSTLSSGVVCASPRDAAVEAYQNLKSSSLEDCIKMREASGPAPNAIVYVTEPKVGTHKKLKCIGIHDSCSGGNTDTAVIFWIGKDGSAKKVGEVVFNGALTLSQTKDSCVAINENQFLPESNGSVPVVFSEYKISASGVKEQKTEVDDHKPQDQPKIKAMRAKIKRLTTEPSECILRKATNSCLFE